MHPLSILFVAPVASSNRLGKDILKNNLYSKKGFIPPLALATINALTPTEFNTFIWDENVHGLITENEKEIENYDIIALSGYLTQKTRILEIACVLRKKGKLLIVGGADVTESPESYRDYFDVIFIGESELLWPQFLNDFQNKNYKKEYVNDAEINLADFPAPDWGNLLPVLNKDYVVGAVQTSRGCPFCCEFCNVWKIFGRKVRSKSVEKIIDEIKVLIDNGVTAISFCDDNFIGNPGNAKNLVRELAKLNRSTNQSLQFFGEFSINVSKDDEMLQLMFDAGFKNCFIGIESPNVESLKETNKLQNVVSDVVSSCKKIMSFGIPVEASMIVGFDSDTEEIFDQQFNFIMDTNIPIFKINMLKVRKKTELWDRMEAQGRILHYKNDGSTQPEFLNLRSNIAPFKMRLSYLHEKYLELNEQLYRWENFYKRLSAFVVHTNQRLNNRQQITSLPVALEQVVKSFEITLQADIESLLLLALNKHTSMVYTVVYLLLRYKDNYKQIQYLNTEGVKGFRLDTVLDYKIR